MAEAYPDDATSAAVIGCGPVGLMAILAAQAQGAEKVTKKNSSLFLSWVMGNFGNGIMS